MCVISIVCKQGFLFCESSEWGLLCTDQCLLVMVFMLTDFCHKLSCVTEKKKKEKRTVMTLESDL